MTDYIAWFKIIGKCLGLNYRSEKIISLIYIYKCTFDNGAKCKSSKNQWPHVQAKPSDNTTDHEMILHWQHPME